MTIHENVKEILHNITKAKSASQKLSVIAVTKSVDTKQTKEIIDAGICHIAENRVDSFLKKYHELEEERLTWHFIGNLQRRKVKEIIDLVDYFHALDSLKLAEEIEKRATHPIKCFIEINVSGEASKQG
ncbi:MAG: YggS family pyridoxal phosphate-dependent enzyme, partial [Streptococcaceae bacterium]|nr:YggS family pyridoxal phosphate-dependent enzyme [Streptococcaceae bacterium]